ncbi:MAG: redoxin domain-containing protein, partial [Candidatus Cloacimonetes bacterium]|nr:redoxin domain-containing protein [Candidatus Cloacimonadota bacterium]
IRVIREQKKGENMRHKLMIILSLMIFLILQSSLAFAEINVKIGDKVPNFTITDADDKEYELEKMKGKIIVLVMGPRSKDENNTWWAEKLDEVYSENDTLEIFTVLDLRGIPFVITREFVIGKVREKQEYYAVTPLLDWKQKVNKLLGAEKKETDIFVINANGILVYHQKGKYSEEALSVVKDKIDETLKVDEENQINLEGGN